MHLSILGFKKQKQPKAPLISQKYLACSSTAKQSMEKTSYLRFKGSRHFRQRLLLSTLSQRSIIIEDIRSDESPPGLKSFDISLLRLIEKISDDGRVVINETGTKLNYKPGAVMGGKKLVHDCGVARRISYFMEPLLILGLRGN